MHSYSIQNTYNLYIKRKQCKDQTKMKNQKQRGKNTNFHSISNTTTRIHTLTNEFNSFTAAKTASKTNTTTKRKKQIFEHLVIRKTQIAVLTLKIKIKIKMKRQRNATKFQQTIVILILILILVTNKAMLDHNYKKRKK